MLLLVLFSWCVMLFVSCDVVSCCVVLGWVGLGWVLACLLQSITNDGVQRCCHTHVLHSAYSSQFVLCRSVDASALRLGLLQSITNNGVKGCCHTHVLYSVYNTTHHNTIEHNTTQRASGRGGAGLWGR